MGERSLQSLAMTSVVALLQELIRIPSVNPDCHAETSPAGERAMAEYLRDLLQPHGFTCVLEEVIPGNKDRVNLIARAPYAEMEGETDERPRIFLGPHLDTVTVEGMNIEPFAAEIREEKIWGRGASDTKGPMAAMLWGLITNAEKLATLPVAVDFVGFCGEEAAQHGSKHFARHHAQEYVFAVAGEPTSLDIVHCTKGSLWATLTATGKAAHASQPHLGENAIQKLMTALEVLLADWTPELTAAEHPVLGHATVNLGTMRGGAQPNIVPDYAEAQLDVRTVPALIAEQSTRATLAEKIQRLELPVTLHCAEESPPMDVPTDNPWVKKICAIHPASALVGAPWFSDAAHLTTAGLPSVCIGPGSIDQAHTKDEFIRVADLEAGGAFFTKLIAEMSEI